MIAALFEFLVGFLIQDYIFLVKIIELKIWDTALDEPEKIVKRFILYLIKVFLKISKVFNWSKELFIKY